MKYLTVCVTGAGGGGFGEQILKALRRSAQPYRLLATDMNRNSAGFCLADETNVLPPASDAGYSKALLELCERYEVRAVLPGSEPEITALSANRQLFEEKGIFAILQSTIYDCWVWKNTSTIGSNGINFAPNDCFENFAFPKAIENLAYLGNAYLLSRKELMLKTQLGLTKIYNLFHSSGISEEINENDKQVKLLRNHLIKIDINTSFEEVIDGIKRLRLLHKLIDEAVIKEYGWTDINLQNDFYDVEYLPEIDRIRYTFHPKARKEILKRLLMLNHQRYKEEVSENSKNIKPNHKKVDNQKKKYNFPKLF